MARRQTGAFPNSTLEALLKDKKALEAEGQALIGEALASGDPSNYMLDPKVAKKMMGIFSKHKENSVKAISLAIEKAAKKSKSDPDYPPPKGMDDYGSLD